MIELQGNWERRRDDRTGLFFFHKLSNNSNDKRKGENYAETCQWEVPATWDGDPLSTDVNSNIHNSASASKYVKNSFQNMEVSDRNSEVDLISELGDEDDVYKFSRKKISDQNLATSEVVAAFEEPADSWAPDHKRSATANTISGNKFSTCCCSLV